MMPSPFPGMDPWLESPYIWGDFHHAYACALSDKLNASLPEGYYSRINFRLNADETKHQCVEVRDSKAEHELITFFDFATPRNKIVGLERRAYLRNRTRLLESVPNFVEIDFLRDGKPLNEKNGDEKAPAPEYAIVIRAPEKRMRMCRTFTFDMTLPLPSIRIPLREGMDGIDVDLQAAFNKVYDSGPYDRGAVDYDQPPEPPLPPKLVKWAEDCLRKAGVA